MKRFGDILESLLGSLNPLKYSLLRQKSLRLGFLHFFLVIFIGVLISGILYYPLMFSVPQDIKNSVAEFEEFNLNPTISTNEPVVIGKNFLVFDTQNVLSPNESQYFVDENFLYYDFGSKRRELAKVGDLIQHKDLIFSLMNLFIIFFIPSFFVGFYALTTLLSFLMIVIFGLIFFMITKIIKKDVKFRDLISSGLYASTFLAIGMIANALNFSLGMFFLAIFALCCLFGALLPVRKMKSDNKKSTKKKKKEDEFGFDD